MERLARRHELSSPRSSRRWGHPPPLRNRPANYTCSKTERYGDRKRFDFFVHHLLGAQPPGWNTASTTTRSTQ